MQAQKEQSVSKSLETLNTKFERTEKRKGVQEELTVGKKARARLFWSTWKMEMWKAGRQVWARGFGDLERESRKQETRKGGGARAGGVRCVVRPTTGPLHAS
jgi:hypothetical protein